MASYNNEHAASIGYVNDAIVGMWDAMKIWVEANIDTSNLMQVVKGILDEANRVIIGTTATEKANAVLSAVNDIADALRSAGATVLDDTPLSVFATLIRQVAATGYEVCILGKSGTHYTVSDWNDYIAQHGTTPEEAVVAVITPYQSFVIGSPTELPEGATVRSYITKQWGNTTDNVQGLAAQQVGSFVNVLQNGLIFESMGNTARMLLWYNPEILPHINYDPSDPTINYNQYYCVRFATKAEMESSGLHLMYNEQVYIATNDETDNTQNQCYYWNGNAYTRRFIVPRFANNITGSPAAEWAWQYKAWNGDTRQYGIPTTNHLLIMYVYYAEINACLSALSLGPLPTGSTWACQQNNANYAFYVTIPTGNTNGNSKSSNYAIVPVAAL